MRNPLVTLSVIVLTLLAVACGPSAKEMGAAKTAHYKGDKLTLFNAARAAGEGKYTLQKVDETALGFQTAGKWYTPDGLVAERQDDMRMVPDRSLNIVLVVTLVADGDSYVIKVEPVMLRYFQGRPNPDKLDAKDPSVPGWVNDRVEALQFEIYNNMKQYEIKEGPGGIQSPPPAAGTAPPATTPPPAGPPADGSGAPTPTTPPAT